VTRPEPVEVVGESIDSSEQIATSTQQFGPEGRQLDRTRATGSVEHPLTNSPFERGDLLTHCRLGVTEPFRSPSKRPFASDCIEGEEVSQFEVTERRH